MVKRTSPGRAGLPLSLAPLTPEEAIRRAMSFPVKPKEAVQQDKPLPPKKLPVKAKADRKK